jgi:hypothetical protein
MVVPDAPDAVAGEIVMPEDGGVDPMVSVA